MRPESFIFRGSVYSDKVEQKDPGEKQERNGLVLRLLVSTGFILLAPLMAAIAFACILGEHPIVGPDGKRSIGNSVPPWIGIPLLVGGPTLFIVGIGGILSAFWHLAYGALKGRHKRGRTSIATNARDSEGSVNSIGEIEATSEATRSTLIPSLID